MAYQSIHITNIGLLVKTDLVLCSHPQPPDSQELLNFLRLKIGLSENAIDLGLKQARLEQAPLPIILWTFGLLSLSQYQEVLDWEKDR